MELIKLFFQPPMVMGFVDLKVFFLVKLCQVLLDLVQSLPVVSLYYNIKQKKMCLNKIPTPTTVVQPSS